MPLESANLLETRHCPACGKENPMDAVFCGNLECHKALGEFRYVKEELGPLTTWNEKLAARGTDFIGKPHFVVAHLVWFAAWVLINTGVFALIHRFDNYPFGLLGIMLAAEAIFIEGFVLIIQNRQTAHSAKRAELDYEVSVKTYRDIVQLDEKLDRLEAKVEELTQLIRAR